jgi:hypothetical protein
MCPATTTPTSGAGWSIRSADQGECALPDGATALPTDIAPALEETVRAHFAKRIAE